MNLAPLHRWLAGSVLFGGLLLTALIESVAIVPTLVMGASFLGLVIAGIAGFFVKGFQAARACAWLLVLSTAANVVGTFVLIELRKGDDITAEALVAAIERHRNERGTYPASLDALVPTYIPALPDRGFGQTRSPYSYQQALNAFTLSYSIGFKASRIYDSRSQAWRTED